MMLLQVQVFLTLHLKSWLYVEVQVAFEYAQICQQTKLSLTDTKKQALKRKTGFEAVDVFVGKTAPNRSSHAKSFFPKSILWYILAN